MLLNYPFSAGVTIPINKALGDVDIPKTPTRLPVLP